MALQPTWMIQSPVIEIPQSVVPMALVQTSAAHLCLVCGGEGRCINYGAYTCQACRAFFRRHAIRPKVQRREEIPDRFDFPFEWQIPACPSNGQCELSVKLQKQNPCIACRLSKCFSVGMSADFAPKEKPKTRMGRSKVLKRAPQQVAVHSLEKHVPQLPTLDLLNNHRADLTEKDWRLLSNIIHAYDNFSSIPHARVLVQRLPDLRQSHTFTQWHFLEHVVSAVRASMTSVPDFQIMTGSEQCSLLERNWYVISGLNYFFVVRDSGLSGSSAFTSEEERVYGTDIVSRGIDIRRRLDSDSTLIKLMFVVHAFSSSSLIMGVPRIKKYDSLTLGTFRLLGSQNVFVELIWKYMMYRYGYRETVLRFASLVKQMLDTMNYVMILYDANDLHHQFVDEALDENKLSLSTKYNTYIPLWGHT